MALLELGLAAGSAYLASRSQKKTNQANVDFAESQNAFQAAEAQKNRDWQERMSNTVYQRGRKDLETAGYNPLLVGSGAPIGHPSMPSASSAHQEATYKADTFKQFNETRMTNASLKNLEAQTAYHAAQADVARKDADAYTPLLAKINAIMKSGGRDALNILGFRGLLKTVAGGSARRAAQASGKSGKLASIHNVSGKYPGKRFFYYD